MDIGTPAHPLGNTAWKYCMRSGNIDLQPRYFITTLTQCTTMAINVYDIITRCRGSYSLLFTCFLYMILFKVRTSYVYSKSNYKKRHKCIRDNYLAGKASQPYTQASTPNIQRSLEKAGPSSSSMEMCSRCFPVLQWYKDQLEQLVQQESTLKKRIKQHPHTCTKQLQTSPYQDFNAQIRG